MELKRADITGRVIRIHNDSKPFQIHTGVHVDEAILCRGIVYYYGSVLIVPIDRYSAVRYGAQYIRVVPALSESGVAIPYILRQRFCVGWTGRRAEANTRDATGFHSAILDTSCGICT